MIHDFISCLSTRLTAIASGQRTDFGSLAYLFGIPRRVILLLRNLRREQRIAKMNRGSMRLGNDKGKEEE